MLAIVLLEIVHENGEQLCLLESDGPNAFLAAKVDE